ncbi:MAG TPA: acetate/propionate family kinase [Candidatus Binatia bacterium]|nr:acetate/propionate family kinase [Candidatus Binatia bacterium]
MRILIVNAGSSSLKLTVLDDGDQVLLAENIPAPAGRLDDAALREAVAQSRPVDAVGHRIVHGGTEFTEPVLVDAQVLRRLEALTDLAPLHQPKSLRGLELVGRMLPNVPAVACFDTAFHAGIPPAASTYALPAPWRKRWELRRFGFHGLSHAYAARRTAELAGRSLSDLQIVTCHLGAGASLAAVRGGTSVDTTMGFTPLEGLVMATRSGSVDPGLLLWLEEHVGMPPTELATTLEHRSGLLGLTGRSDMSGILQAEADGDADAGLAVSVYVHRLRAGIAAMTAAMSGLDALTFTGGVGEHAPEIRRRAADGLGFLGIGLDPGANQAVSPDAEIGAPGASVRSFVVQAREDLEIARGVRQVLGGAALPSTPGGSAR